MVVLTFACCGMEMTLNRDQFFKDFNSKGKQKNGMWYVGSEGIDNMFVRIVEIAAYWYADRTGPVETEKL